MDPFLVMIKGAAFADIPEEIASEALAQYEQAADARSADP
jgi:hypothetical protein